MQANEQELSTRDLASGNDSSADAVAVDQPERQDAEDGAPASRPADDLSDAKPPAEDRSEAGAPAGDLSEAQPSSSGSRPASAASDTNEPLLTTELSGTFHQQWEEIQTRFVDEPRGAVEEADGLVASLMQQLAESFAQERERLEAQWGRGEDISTEDLRVALQRYRSFFQRLLST